MTKLGVTVLLILFAIGCAEKFQSISQELRTESPNVEGLNTWKELEEHADITFQEGVVKGGALRIPVTVKPHDPDSKQVVDLQATLEFNHPSMTSILITGRLRPADEKRIVKHELTVPIDGPSRESVTIVYKNPDGLTQIVTGVNVR